MQRIRTIMAVLALVSVLCTPASFAQQREPLPGQKPRAPIAKATTFIGSAVVNAEGESLGKIEDLVIDPVTGGITYAAMSHGSILGMGGKLLAVPWKALQLQADGTTFSLNLSKEMLERAPGFDKNNWPQRPDPMLSAAMRKPETGASPATTATPGAGVAATVQAVDAPAESITLRTEKGDSVELRAPTTMLTGLQPGDIVEVKMVGMQATEIYKKK